MQYVAIFLSLFFLVSCTNSPGTGKVVGDNRPTTGTEGVPGYILKPTSVLSKIENGILTITAPAGTVVSTKAGAQVPLTAWNTTLDALKAAVQTESGTASLSQGQSILTGFANADGSISFSVTNPSLALNTLTLFIYDELSPGQFTISNNSNEITAVYQLTTQILNNTPFISAFTLIHTIFVTSDKYTASYASADLSTADAACAALAASGTKTKTLPAYAGWKAIISNTTTNARDRVLFHPNSTIRNTLGQTVVQMSSSLWSAVENSPSQVLENAIQANESGVIPSGQNYAWTGTQPNGLAYPSLADNCTNWSRNADGEYGVVGNSVATDFSWLGGPVNTYSMECGLSRDKSRFYCVNSAE